VGEREITRERMGGGERESTKERERERRGLRAKRRARVSAPERGCESKKRKASAFDSY